MPEKYRPWVHRLACRYIGHRWDVGPWKRSPHTVYTHWRDISCGRCGFGMSEKGYANFLPGPGYKLEPDDPAPSKWKHA